MANRSEYSGATVGSAGCNYTNLDCYLGSNSMMAPSAWNAKTAPGVYVTPNYSAIGYDALTHGSSGSCNSYFNIESAYGAGAAGCNTTYTNRLCNGGCGKVGGKGCWACTGGYGGKQICTPVQCGTRGAMSASECHKTCARR